jgi:hypothetical protein
VELKIFLNFFPKITQKEIKLLYYQKYTREMSPSPSPLRIPLLRNSSAYKAFPLRVNPTIIKLVSFFCRHGYPNSGMTGLFYFYLLLPLLKTQLLCHRVPAPFFFTGDGGSNGMSCSVTRFKMFINLGGKSIFFLTFYL